MPSQHTYMPAYNCKRLSRRCDATRAPHIIYNATTKRRIWRCERVLKLYAMHIKVAAFICKAFSFVAYVLWRANENKCLLLIFLLRILHKHTAAAQIFSTKHFMLRAAFVFSLQWYFTKPHLAHTALCLTQYPTHIHINYTTMPCY